MGRSFRRGLLARQGLDGVDTDFNCPKARPWASETVAIRPGDQLHKLIVAKYGIKPCSRCLEVIENMNGLGPEGCVEQRELILDDIWQRRDKLKGWRKVAAKLPGSEIAAKRELGRLFDEAMERALKA